MVSSIVLEEANPFFFCFFPSVFFYFLHLIDRFTFKIPQKVLIDFLIVGSTDKVKLVLVEVHHKIEALVLLPQREQDHQVEVLQGKIK